MAVILHIETSTTVCSVALSCDSQVLFSSIDEMGSSHVTLIGPYLDKALDEARSLGKRLDAVAVSAGPGSYTGLRIGVSAAKGICYALNIPLIAVSTLELLAETVRQKGLPAGVQFIRPVMDARRMEVYTARFAVDGRRLEGDQAVVVDEDTFNEELDSAVTLFVGSGAEKLEAIIKANNARFDKTINPVASNLFFLAEKAFMAGSFVHVAYFEPYYLKDFIATVKKQLIPVK
jgi:tRNA threonylcarbamoyladenosine biosynthesis protein TsaB